LRETERDDDTLPLTSRQLRESTRCEMECSDAMAHLSCSSAAQRI
jgi:hypothetical protein